MRFSAIHFDSKRGKRHTILCTPSFTDGIDTLVRNPSDTFAQNASSDVPAQIASDTLAQKASNTFGQNASNTFGQNASNTFGQNASRTFAPSVPSDPLLFSDHLSSTLLQRASHEPSQCTVATRLPLTSNCMASHACLVSSSTSCNDTGTSAVADATISAVNSCTSSSRKKTYSDASSDPPGRLAVFRTAETMTSENKPIVPKRCASFSFVFPNFSFSSAAPQSATTSDDASSSLPLIPPKTSQDASLLSPLSESNPKRLQRSAKDFDSMKQQSESDDGSVDDAVIEEKLPLVVEGIGRLATQFETAFGCVLNQNFKRKSYGVICIEVADSFQKQFLALLASLVSCRRDLFFVSRKKNSGFRKLLESSCSAAAVTADSITLKNKETDTPGKSCGSRDEGRRRGIGNDEWKIDDSGKVVSVLVRNVNVDKSTNEVAIRYYGSNDTDVESEKEEGVWMTTEELRYLLSISTKYEDEIKKKLRIFWENATDIHILALKKAEDELQMTMKEEVNEENKKRKRDDEAQERLKYGELEKIFTMELQQNSKKRIIPTADADSDIPKDDEMTRNKCVKFNEAHPSALASSSFVKVVSGEDVPPTLTPTRPQTSSFSGKKADAKSSCPQQRPSKRFEVVSLADVKNLSLLVLSSPGNSLSLSDTHLESLEHRSLSKPNQTPKAAMEPAKMLPVSSEKARQDPVPLPRGPSRKKAKAEEIIGLKTLRKLHHKLISSLEATNAETRMLVELASELTLG